METEIVVAARNLNRVFGEGPSEVHAVRDVNLNIDRGSFVAITGPSGCGKSTLLHLLAGLETPSNGEVWVGSKQLDKMNEGKRAKCRRRNVGFVYQFFNLLPSLTVAENVDLPMRLAGRRKIDARRRSLMLLDQLGIGDRGHRSTGRWNCS